MKKWIVVITYLIIIIIGFIYRDFLIGWIQDSDPSQLLLMLFISVFLSTIPVIPFTLFAGIMGMKYGIFLGFFINWFGGLVAAVIYYLLARYLLSGFFKEYVLKYRAITTFNQHIKRNAFLAVFLSRMIPVIPPPVVNIYSALSKIQFPIYFTATALGKIPPTFFIAFGGNQLFSHPKTFMLGLIVYGLFLVLIFFFYRITFKSKAPA